jgi:hypothetical protein
MFKIREHHWILLLESAGLHVPHFVSRAPRGANVARATRGEGRNAFDLEGLGAGRRTQWGDAAEDEEERCNTRSAFETSKYNSYNIHLKVDKTLAETLEKTPENTWKPL